MWADMAGVVIGGVLSLLGSAIVCAFQSKENTAERKHTETLHLMEKKEAVYEALAAALDDISIAITPSEQQPDAFCIDFESYRRELILLNQTLQETQGKVALYASAKVRRKIVELKADIYALSISDSKESIPLQSFKESHAYAAAMKAQSLLNLLRTELGVSNRQ